MIDRLALAVAAIISYALFKKALSRNKTAKRKSNEARKLLISTAISAVVFMTVGFLMEAIWNFPEFGVSMAEGVVLGWMLSLVGKLVDLDL